MGFLLRDFLEGKTYCYVMLLLLLLGLFFITDKLKCCLQQGLFKECVQGSLALLHH